MRIALWNASSLDNLGDKLLDAVNRRELGRRLPSATFETFSPWPSPTHRQVLIDADGRWCGESTFDAIVIGGGALLVGPPFVHPSLQTCYLGPYPLRFRDRIPIVWNAVCSDAQFVSTLSDKWRGYVRAAASRLTYRSVRNVRTAEMLTECGVTEEIDVVPDPVVLFDKPTCPRASRRGRRRIGLAISDSSRSDAMIAHLMVRSSAACNHDVTIAVGPEAFMDSDAGERRERFMRAATALVGRLPSADIEVCGFGAVYGDTSRAALLGRRLGAAPVSVADGVEAVSWMRSLDCLVASRLHAVILSVVAGTPVVAIDPYYNPIAGTSKLMEFMSGAGLLDSYATAEQFARGDVDTAQLIEFAIVNRHNTVTVHERLAESSNRHFDYLAALLTEEQEPSWSGS